MGGLPVIWHLLSMIRNTDLTGTTPCVLGLFGQMLFTPWNGRFNQVSSFWESDWRDKKLIPFPLLQPCIAVQCVPPVSVPAPEAKPCSKCTLRSCVPALLEPVGTQPLLLFLPPALLEKHPLKSMSSRELVLPLHYQNVGQGRWIAKIQPGGR